jgi:hypothetical protein
MDNPEQHRHRCEVRHLLARTHGSGLGWLKGFVEDWKRWPGSQLQKDFWTQHKAGNTGQAGDWRVIEGRTGTPATEGPSTALAATNNNEGGLK